MNFNGVIHTCKVCELVNGDKTPKRVTWCDKCSAYICKECFDDWPKRAKAAALNYGNELVEKTKEIIAPVKAAKKRFFGK